MRQSRKSKVSWPSDADLCQVKLFVAEDCPSKVTSQPQNHNQWKPSSIKPLKKRLSPDLPPGYEGNAYATNPRQSLSQWIKWKCPPKFILNSNWLVAAGEESTERQTQNLREAKVLEAVYPHRSAIPSCPSVLIDVEALHYDDSKTPLIRLTPIEEDEEATTTSSHTAPQTNMPVKPQLQSVSETPSPLKSNIPSTTEKPALDMASGLRADVGVAASAVLTALMKSKEQGSMIDTDLLVKILRDPKMVENLIKDQRPKPMKKIPHVDTKSAPVFVSQPVSATSASLPCSNPTIAPMVLGRNSQPLPKGMPLKPSFTTSQPHTYLGLESNVVEPVIPKCSSEPTKVSSPRLANGSQIITAVQVQPGSDMMSPPLLKHVQTAPLTFTALPRNLKPVQGPAGSKRVQTPQPSFNTRPMNAKPVQVSAGMKPNPLVKDLDYIKNLIREHGTVKADTHDNNPFPSQSGHHYYGHGENINLAQNLKPGEIKAKIQKPCMYFTSSKGCKLGANCMYLHDPSQRWRTGSALEVPSAKKTKFSGEIRGR